MVLTKIIYEKLTTTDLYDNYQQRTWQSAEIKKSKAVDLMAVNVT